MIPFVQDQGRSLCWAKCAGGLVPATASACIPANGVRATSSELAWTLLSLRRLVAEVYRGPRRTAQRGSRLQQGAAESLVARRRILQQIDRPAAGLLERILGAAKKPF